MCLADADTFASRMSVLVTNIKMLTETLLYPEQAVKSVFPLKDYPYLLDNFDLDFVLNSKQLFAEALAKQVLFNAVNRVEEVLDSQAMFAEITVEKDIVLNNAKLQEVKPVLQSDFLIFGVLRRENVQIPKGDFVLREGDSLRRE